jgi:hypothetical protein
MASNTESGWPLVLSAEATVPSQTTQRPPQLALMNPTGEAFKIHEVRWTLTTAAIRVTGCAIGCKLDLGQVAITNGFVPVWNFGRVISYDQDLSCQYSWRLAQPIYVPAGGVVEANFQNFGLVSDEITVRISYFCTAIPNTQRPPKRIFLPWVSAYIGKVFAYGAEDADTSKENQLQNPFDTDLVISRLIGRFNFFTSSTQTNASLFGANLLNARVSLSNGDPLVRTSTPFQQVFSEEGRSWEQKNTILKPKQYFQVFVEKASTTDTSSNTTVQPFVSLVGYREMEFKAGEQ